MKRDEIHAKFLRFKQRLINVTAGASVFLGAWTEVALNNHSAKVVQVTLWTEQLDRDVVEGGSRFVAGDMG